MIYIEIKKVQPALPLRQAQYNICRNDELK